MFTLNEFHASTNLNDKIYLTFTLEWRRTFAHGACTFVYNYVRIFLYLLVQSDSNPQSSASALAAATAPCISSGFTTTEISLFACTIVVYGIHSLIR